MEFLLRGLGKDCMAQQYVNGVVSLLQMRMNVNKTMVAAVRSV